MTIDQYEAKLASQNGVCAICGRPPKTIRLNVDHNHLTNTVRGLLCVSCNRAVGYIENLEWHQKALAYLALYS